MTSVAPPCCTCSACERRPGGVLDCPQGWVEPRVRPTGSGRSLPSGRPKAGPGGPDRWQAPAGPGEPAQWLTPRNPPPRSWKGHDGLRLSLNPSYSLHSLAKDSQPRMSAKSPAAADDMGAGLARLCPTSSEPQRPSVSATAHGKPRKFCGDARCWDGGSHRKLFPTIPCTTKAS